MAAYVQAGARHCSLCCRRVLPGRACFSSCGAAVSPIPHPARCPPTHPPPPGLSVRRWAGGCGTLPARPRPRVTLVIRSRSALARVSALRLPPMLCPLRCTPRAEEACFAAAGAAVLRPRCRNATAAAQFSSLATPASLPAPLRHASLPACPTLPAAPSTTRYLPQWRSTLVCLTRWCWRRRGRG